MARQGAGLADGLTRGDFIVVALQGDYGKPRPAIVVQSDFFVELPSVLICPLSSDIRDDADMFRLTVEPSVGNGLRELSQIAIDKLSPIARSKVGQRIGTADAELMHRVDTAMVLMLGLTHPAGPRPDR